MILDALEQFLHSRSSFVGIVIIIVIALYAYTAVIFLRRLNKKSMATQISSSLEKAGTLVSLGISVAVFMI